jgi:hypothetical protein
VVGEAASAVVAARHVIIVELLGLRNGGVKCGGGGMGRLGRWPQSWPRSGEGCNPSSVKLQKTEPNVRLIDRELACELVHSPSSG